ncbi:MAG TPA: formate dehydrogenase accessory sulfurtransferase FdhD [Parafilimonas sp.]|nr:formate dehydrogenase accessory sulfurtransferase FdhD [Parafilimonas sp.]
MDPTSVAHMTIKKISTDVSVDAEDELAIEEPLAIQLMHGPKGNEIQSTISVTMRTPGNDEELALGFLFTEGIIQSGRQVKDITIIDDNNVLVSLFEDQQPVLKNAERNFYTTSSCGVCGKSSIDAVKTVSQYSDVFDDIHVGANLFYRLENTLRKKQAIFESTGGLHASALFDLDGNFIMLREDVGRHNALDKLIGAAVKQGDLPLTNSILLLSGRASFELIQKASMAGIKIIAAVGAPSSLAVQIAEETGITLIGFLRSHRFNIYSCSHRIEI